MYDSDFERNEFPLAYLITIGCLAAGCTATNVNRLIVTVSIFTDDADGWKTRNSKV